ncbi:MAG: sugar ABC transporter permease [Clostridia bacterium]|nr:sugar ABC transporter permease [Clostridia bacterium]
MGYLFVLPFIIGLLAIFLPSLYDSIVYSLSEVSIRLDAVTQRGVGFQNYIQAFTEDTEFRVLLLSAIQRTVQDLVVIVIFSFFIATLLNQEFVGRGFARTIFFLPVILATGIIANADANSLVMNTFAASTNTDSVISSAFGSGGLQSLLNLQDLLSSMNLNKTVMQTILTAVDNTYNVVNSSGVQIIIFLAALQSISPSIFEAARVEGATKWEEFWKITFPMITPMILVNVVYTIVDSFTNPQYGILEYIQEQAFSNSQIGFASALSWIYFIFVGTLLALVTFIISKRIHYLD